MINIIDTSTHQNIMNIYILGIRQANYLNIHNGHYFIAVRF